MSPLYALYVNDDNDNKPHTPARRVLEMAAKTASAADTQLIPISRYDLNIASGIIHTIKEKNISEVVIGLHHKANIVDTFFGTKIEAILKGTHKMVWITKCVNPPATATRIVWPFPLKPNTKPAFHAG